MLFYQNQVFNSLTLIFCIVFSNALGQTNLIDEFEFKREIYKVDIYRDNDIISTIIEKQGKEALKVLNDTTSFTVFSLNPYIFQSKFYGAFKDKYLDGKPSVNDSTLLYKLSEQLYLKIQTKIITLNEQGIVAGYLVLNPSVPIERDFENFLFSTFIKRDKLREFFSRINDLIDYMEELGIEGSENRLLHKDQKFQSTYEQAIDLKNYYYYLDSLNEKKIQKKVLKRFQHANNSNTEYIEHLRAKFQNESHQKSLLRSVLKYTYKLETDIEKLRLASKSIDEIERQQKELSIYTSNKFQEYQQNLRDSIENANREFAIDLVRDYEDALNEYLSVRYFRTKSNKLVYLEETIDEIIGSSNSLIEFNRIKFRYGPYSEKNIQVVDARKNLESAIVINNFPETLAASDKIISQIEIDNNKSIDQIESQKEQIISDLNSEQISLKYFIDSVSIEFYEGTMKKIVVMGTLNQKELIFTNKVAISFSSFSDFKEVGNIELVEFAESDNRYSIKLQDLLRYVPKLQLNSEDYSPGNSVISVKPSSKSIILLKEKQSQLLNAKIYSDFVGLDEEEPNGLIQIEVSKNITINPAKIIIDKKSQNFYFGYLNSYEPTVTIRKIEGNNREFVLKQSSSDTLSDFVSTLELHQFANLDVNAINLNLFVIEAPNLKSTFKINSKFSLLRTTLQDTIPLNTVTNQLRDRIVTTLFYGGQASWILKPDPRYGFDLSFGLGMMDPLDEDLAVVDDTRLYLDSGEKESSSLISSFSLDTFLQLNPENANKGKIFFRARNHWLFSHPNINYFQIQFGYSFNIVKQTGFIENQKRS